MSKDYKEISKSILSHIGGKENVISAAHCATRLRLVLNDDKKVKVKEIEAMPAVKGSFNTSGQFQIILGSGVVDEVYKEFIKLANIKEGSKEELKKEADKKLNPLQRLLKSLADVFVPILPILVAAGLLMGINNILTSQGLFIEGQSIVEAYPQFKDLAELINTFANTGFAFLPIFLGFSAAKAFGGNPYLGACIGALMIHSDLLNGYSYGAAVVEGTVTVDEINAKMKASATESFGYNTDEIVSSDIVGMRYGSLFDATQTMVLPLDNGTTEVQVVSWYDNENSYTSQMVRTIKYFSELA